MSLIENAEFTEHDPSRELWLVTFKDGEEYACFSEEEVIAAFGENTGNYIVIKGVWRPVDA